MKKIIKSIFLWFISFVILYEIVGFTNAVNLICLAALSAYFFYKYWANTLNDWLDKKNIAQIPEGNGVWSEIFSKLYKSYRADERSKKELNLTLEQFIAAAEAMLDGVIAINQNNEILWCNKPAQTMLKINLKKNYKQPINYVFRNTDFSNYLDKEIYEETIKILNQENQQTIEIKITPFRSNMRLITCRDITQIISNENIRKDFVSNFSHELKTPLTVIVGFLETLENSKSKIDKETMQIFGMMTDQAIRMKKLIDDLLLLSNVESNQLQNRSEKINMEKLFLKINKEIALIDQKEHLIEYKINKGINLKKPKFLINEIEYFFGEDQGRYIIEITKNNLKKVTDILNKNAVHFDELGTINKDQLFINDKTKVSIDELETSNTSWLTNYMSK